MNDDQTEHLHSSGRQTENQDRSDFNFQDRRRLLYLFILILMINKKTTRRITNKLF